MTEEDLGKGIIYTDGLQILKHVPNQETIRISNLTKEIYGISTSEYAFRGSVSTLRSFSFMPNSSLQKIDTYAFYQCSLLEKIDLSECKQLEIIENYAFSGCSSVTELLLPNTNLRELGQDTFSSIQAKTIIFPKSIEKMASSFYSSLIQEVIFEEGCKITAFPWGSFGYTQIKNFTIPPSVTSIEGSAFYGTSMEYINIDNRSTSFVVKNNCLYDISLKKLIYYPILCKNKLIVETTVEIISNSAFQFSSASDIILPPNLKTMEYYSFSGIALKTIEIPASLTSMGDGVFSFSSSLETINLSKSINLTSIPTSCFISCSSLSKVVLPSSIKQIGGGAFSNCAINLEIIFGGDSTLKLDKNTSLVMSNDGTIISCYIKMSDIQTEIIIPEAAQTIKSYCFQNQNEITSIKFSGTNLVTIEDYAFAGLKNLIDFSIPSSVQVIGQNAFEGSSIFSVELNSVTSLGKSCFLDCNTLGTVTINNLETIPDNCFQRCKCLKSIQINNNLKTIGAFAFDLCEKFVQFNTDLYNQSQRRRLSSSENIFYFPKTLISISENAFRGTGLSKIYFQDSSEMRTIQGHAFNGSNIENIDLPDEITSIGVEAFAYTKLKSFIVPLHTTFIDRGCFSYCNDLQTLIIKEKCELSNFGDSVFLSCPSLSKIECNSTNFSVINEALYDRDLKKLIVYPPASKQEIFSLPQSITTISIAAFYGALNLKSIQIPDKSLSVIGQSAFENCKNLQIISLPQCIKHIDANAFKGCNKIQCGQIISLNEELKETLVKSAKFPVRGLHSCFEISCNQINLKHISSLAYISLIFTILC